MVVLLQHSKVPFALTACIEQVLYLLEMDRDLLELCLIAMVELLRTQVLPQTTVAAIDSAYTALICDLNEAGLRVLLHALILHSYTGAIRTFAGTFAALERVEMREDGTNHAFLHLQARLRVLGVAACSSFEALYDSEESYVSAKQYLGAPETYLECLERWTVLAALGERAELREAVDKLLPQACTNSDIVLPFRRFEYEEGEYEEWLDFSQVMQAIASEAKRLTG